MAWPVQLFFVLLQVLAVQNLPVGPLSSHAELAGISREKRNVFSDAWDWLKTEIRFTNFAKLKDYLYIGGYWSVTRENLQKLGITAVVNAGYPLGMRTVVGEMNLAYFQVPILDLPFLDIKQYFDPVAEFIEQQRFKNGGTGRIFVNCMEGVSRSASLITAYLLRFDERQPTLEQALAMLRSVRNVRINSGFMKQLKEYAQDIYARRAAAASSRQRLQPPVLQPQTDLAEGDDR